MTETDTVEFDAVLFDFGGVFMDSPFAHAEEAAARLGIPFERLSTVVFGSYDRDDDHPWQRSSRSRGRPGCPTSTPSTCWPR